MSYLVLARKYRPQSFSEIIGQEQVTTTLQNAISRGRVHHAFLFCGGRGTGKTTTARILAKALCCIQAPTSTPCNQCTACVEITQGTSVDVQEIDAASQNKVEDIRELRESIRYAPLRGKKKVFILDEIHMLSTSAFNALLKTLEEPPPHAVFIFATTDPHKIPATILSRVQRYDFRLVSNGLLMEHMAYVLTKENIRFEQEALLLIAQEGGGSVRDCLSLLDQILASHPETLNQETVAHVLGIADRTLLFKLGDAVLRKDASEALDLLQLAYKRGYDLVSLAKTFVGFLRDVLLVKILPNPDHLLEATTDELRELKRLAALSSGTLELMFHRMVRTVEEMARSSFPKVMFEVGIVELCHTEPLIPLHQLIDRLDTIEHKAGMTSKNEISLDKKKIFVEPTPPVVTKPIKPLEKAASDQNLDRHAEVLGKETQEHPKETQEETPTFEVMARQLVEKAPLLHPVALSHPLLWDGKSLILGVRSAFVAEQIRGKWDLLQKSLQDLLHRSISVEVRVISEESFPTPKESLLELEQKKINERQQEKRHAALSHPSRAMVTEVFGQGTVFQEPILE